MAKPLFLLGQVVLVPGALVVTTRSAGEVSPLLVRVKVDKILMSLRNEGDQNGQFYCIDCHPKHNA